MSRIKLKKLFEPLTVGRMTLKNRVVMPPMGTNYADAEGLVTDRIINYYADRAMGGTGLVIVEVACVDAPLGKYLDRQLCVHDDACIPGLRCLASAVQSHGARIALQLHFAGRFTESRVTGMQPVAPSPIPFYRGEVPRELTIPEIEKLIRAFAQAAGRTKRAGFDAVELHCAHGYIMSQFLSPLTNRRKDKYGNDDEGRLRFALEVLTAVRETVGPGYPVICRISGDEGLPGGLTLKDNKMVAHRLQEAGADAIDVSAGAMPSTKEEARQQSLSIVPGAAVPPGCFTHLARGIRHAVKVPVIAVGRITTPELAEEILQKGDADLIAIGRGLIADAYWVRKAATGDTGNINQCIACCKCQVTLPKETALVCTVNQAAGHEGD